MRTHRHLDRTAERLAAFAIGLRDDPGDVVQLAGGEVETEQRSGDRTERAVVRLIGEFVDRDAFLAELLVEQTPVGGAVRSVRQPRRHRQQLDAQRVARLRSDDVDRPGHDVHARGPVRFGNSVPDRPDPVVHQEVRRVAGVVGDRLDDDLLAGLDLHDRSFVGVEVAPEARVGGRRQPLHGQTVGPPCFRSVSHVSQPRQLSRRAPISYAPGRDASGTDRSARPRSPAPGLRPRGRCRARPVRRASPP